MMLDAKRTFDQLIERLAPDARTRDEVFANRIYQQLSSAVAGSQEFTAIAKLYELDQEGGYDLLVLDTPPSRNALDFLDAPGRLTRFFQGRAIRMFLRPAGPARAAGRGLVFGILQRVTGVDLLDDLSVFFRSLGGMIDGFTERARARRRAAAGPGDDVPDRHRAASRPGRGGDLLPPQAARRRDAVRRAGDQPRAPARRTAAVPPALGPALAERVAETTRELAALAERDAANIAPAAARARRPAGARGARARRTTCTTSRG